MFLHKVTWKNTYQGLVRLVEHPVKFREAPQKPQTTTQTKTPQRIVIGSCFQKIILKNRKESQTTQTEIQLKIILAKLYHLVANERRVSHC